MNRGITMLRLVILSRKLHQSVQVCTEEKQRMGFKSKRSDQAAFIAEKVQFLFATIRAPSGAEYTPEELQEATGIHASTIRRLRNGKIGNPGRDVLEALTNFFGIEPQYWFRAENVLPQAAQAANHIRMLHRQIDAADLTDEQARFVAQMLNQVLESVKNLPGTKASDRPIPPTTRSDNEA